MLPLETGIAAVRLARAEAEDEVLRARRRARSAEGLDEPRGAFVSVHVGAELRGCVGYVEPDGPLHEVIAEAARGAVRDPRFDPVRPRELDAVCFEVSVLTPPVPLRYGDPMELPERVRIGEHGLVVQSGRRRGLLLPQVAVEHGFTVEEFLSATCHKARLPREAWRNDGLAWSVFEADVFQEEAPRGAIRAQRDERPELG
jgi:hypothetical protein